MPEYEQSKAKTNSCGNAQLYFRSKSLHDAGAITNETKLKKLYINAHATRV
jgi:hypothetical protein